MIDHDNLEDFADAETYDVVCADDTGVQFYTELARETGGPVLEIACGTGRVGIPIARTGLAVTGVDLVPGMIERARYKSAGLPARWVLGDARTFELGERFGLIFLTGNAFQMFLTRTDQEALFARVHAHLHDGGLFAFETRNPRWTLPDGRDEEGWFAPLSTSDVEEQGETYMDAAGRAVRVTLRRTYDHVSQIMYVTSQHRRDDDGNERVRTVRIALRFTFPQELAALLHYNGFTVERQYGDWDLSPLTATSPSIIVVCRALR